MIATNRIWHELKQAKANTECLLSYTDKKRKMFRGYNILLIFISSLGALLSIQDSIFAVIATIIIAAASILKTAMPNFIQSEQELAELDRLLEFYNKYMNKLEELWYKRSRNTINDDEMMSLLFVLKHE